MSSRRVPGRDHHALDQKLTRASAKQNQNSKLFSFNKDFWESRASVADPRAMFRDENGHGAQSHGQSAVDRARAIKEAKLRAGKEDLGH